MNTSRDAPKIAHLFREIHCLRCGQPISAIQEQPVYDLTAGAAIAIICQCRHKYDVLRISRAAILSGNLVGLLPAFIRRRGYTLGALSHSERWSVLEDQLAVGF